MPRAVDQLREEWMWEALARGDLPAEWVAMLRVLAESDPRLERRLAAYQPLSRCAVERIIRAAERTVVALPRRPRRGERG